MAAMANPARVVARKSSAYATPRTRPTIARTARPEESCWPTVLSAVSCARTGHAHRKNWKSAAGPDGAWWQQFLPGFTPNASVRNERHPHHPPYERAPRGARRARFVKTNNQLSCQCPLSGRRPKIMFLSAWQPAFLPLLYWQTPALRPLSWPCLRAARSRCSVDGRRLPGAGS